MRAAQPPRAFGFEDDGKNLVQVGEARRRTSHSTSQQYAEGHEDGHRFGEDHPRKEPRADLPE